MLVRAALRLASAARAGRICSTLGRCIAGASSLRVAKGWAWGGTLPAVRAPRGRASTTAVGAGRGAALSGVQQVRNNPPMNVLN